MRSNWRAVGDLGDHPSTALEALNIKTRHYPPVVAGRIGIALVYAVKPQSASTAWRQKADVGVSVIQLIAVLPRTGLGALVRAPV